MSKVTATLLSTALACALGAVLAAGAATAFPGPFYHVEGAKIGATAKNLTIAIKPGTSVKLNSTVGGISVEAVCKGVKSEGAVFFNATLQGESEMTRLIYEECTVTKPSLGCSVTGGGFSSKPVYAFLDYEKNPEPARTAITEYFRPKTGSEFASVQLGGLCAGTYIVTGTVVANTAPERTEAREGEVIFPATPIIRTWDTVAGNMFKEYSAGLELAGKAATLSGSLIVKMESGEKFGVYDE